MAELKKQLNDSKAMIELTNSDIGQKVNATTEAHEEPVTAVQIEINDNTTQNVAPVTEAITSTNSSLV